MSNPTVTQVRLSIEGGMSYAVKLTDGSFVMIDGGESDKCGSGSYKENSTILWDFLKRNSEGKPHIRYWMITHFHLDHVDMATEFIREYRDELIIDGFAYNHPGHDASLVDEEREREWLDAIALYPNAEKRVLKTGETILLPDAKIEVYLSENDPPYDIQFSQNAISAAFKITFATGKSFTVLGDCDTGRLSELMDPQKSVYRTKEELKTDVLQVAHHGLPMGEQDTIDKNAELYKLMDPFVCFFPINEYNFLNNRRYTDPSFTDNQYLLKSRYERCYHQTQTVTVDMKTLEISVEK